MELTDNRIKETLKPHTTWQDAVIAVLDLWSIEKRCFSSGEVAAAIRFNKPEIRFAVTTLGSFLKDLFWSDEMPPYLTGAVAQISRFTTGRFPNRTPVDTEVFVYGPDTDTCNSHEFEIFVPKPGETMADAPAPAVKTTVKQTGPSTKHHRNALTIYGSKVGVSEIRASVWNHDCRLTIPRTAFEALCHLSDATVKAGDPVYVLVDLDNQKVKITLEDCNDGSKAYSLVKEKGRVSFSSGDKDRPFPAGANYKICVSMNEITIDISKVL